MCVSIVKRNTIYSIYDCICTTVCPFYLNVMYLLYTYIWTNIFCKVMTWGSPTLNVTIVFPGAINNLKKRKEKGKGNTWQI